MLRRIVAYFLTWFWHHLSERLGIKNGQPYGQPFYCSEAIWRRCGAPQSNVGWNPLLAVPMTLTSDGPGRRLPEFAEYIILHGLREIRCYHSPPDEIEITTMRLHKLDECLISVGTVTEKLCDEAKFKRYCWHSVVATPEKREMLPRATSKGFYSIGV